MVQAWYMKDDVSEENRQEELHLSPPEFIDLDQLYAKTGVLYWKINADDYEKDELYAKIRSDRGYSYQDNLELSRDRIADYEQKCKIFFTEHIHSDEEIRFVLNGSGYFDVRDHEDKWIRIKVEKNDLIVLPAGIYHRFTLDKKDYIKVIRLFVGEPVWTAINRPADDHPARVRYLQSKA
ncbi:Putative 1, 2-dihydroxy-3-keto-5-methylthiopentene dioxygenase [Sarcoptes scabiei]|uniref:Acireductone dioxygenase n=1 Tax=Sarcoptes scabiei TaxID=52283 RepID=A0A834VDK6_SARSC|nr:Putative 1, 2-dihydroxy-3-keto-5-methylthiopentene dioxygenase [Sarcoptes scabiei]